MKKIRAGDVEVCGAPYPPVTITLSYESAQKLRRVLGEQSGRNGADVYDVYAALDSYLEG